MKTYLSLIIFWLMLGDFAWAARPVISIHQYDSRPALESIVQGLQDSLGAQGIDAEYRVHLAYGNPATAKQIAAQMANEHADLFLAIGQQSSEAVVPVFAGISGLLKPLLLTAVTMQPEELSWPAQSQQFQRVVGIESPEEIFGLIKSVLPRIKRLGVVFTQDETESAVRLRILQKLAGEHAVSLIEAPVGKPAQLYPVSRKLAKEVEATLVFPDSAVWPALDAVIRAAVENRVPLFSLDTGTVAKGVMASTGCDTYGLGYKTGIEAKKMLTEGLGKKTEQTSYQQALLAVNLRSAALMKVKFPPEVLRRASMVCSGR